ncbi:MAG: hypothetical protein KJ950_00220 [Proteobacteria bacterium]|nr:hypothetical protein [Pseudomonadota bacterium]MBU1687535.1 hypothetical protein [Pseudomonadota bacterium]
MAINDHRLSIRLNTGVAMDVDISRVLTYEIKREIAERYFGFRKLIEEDKQDLALKIQRHVMTSEQLICFDLVRIYIILRDRRLINEFLTLTGLREEIFYDEYLVSSPTIKSRVFEGIKGRGLTRAGRFTNLFFGSYALLVDHVDDYREKYGELLETREFINEEIKLFYRKNDIGSIMGFLRNLEPSQTASHFQPPPQGRGNEELERKLRVVPPDPLEHQLPVIPPLIPLTRIRRSLKKLAEEALKVHSGNFP